MAFPIVLKTPFIQPVTNWLALGLIVVFATLPGGATEESTQKKITKSVVLDTSKGQIKIKVFAQDVPMTASNFLDLVKRGFYNGTKFHRYEEGFVIQGGSRTGPDGVYISEKTGKPRLIPLEKVKELNHGEAGMVGMARETDPDSASCQFYFILSSQPALDQEPGYAVFGQVTSGMENVENLRVGDQIKEAYIEGEAPLVPIAPAKDAAKIAPEPAKR